MERVLFAPRELPPLGPDVSQDLRLYTDWVRRREEQRRRRRPTPSGPRTSTLGLVMAVADAPPTALLGTLAALREQTSARWTLSLVCGEERLTEVEELAHRVMGRRARRHIACRAAGPALTEQVWAAVTTRHGGGLALLFPGDLWAGDAVALLGRALTPTGVVYADNDFLSRDATCVSPRFKPDYSPDLLLSSSYVGSPLAIGSVIANTLPRPVGTNWDSVEHEWALYACEAASAVTHIPEVLCHRAATLSHPKSAGDGRHVEAELRRRGDAAAVVKGVRPGTFHLRRPVKTGTMASIVIPFRDQPRLLRTCVDSVEATAGECPAELILVDNGSTDPEVATLLERLSARPDVHVVADARPFNWAQLNNVGAERARGDVLLFLNNDIEARQPGWLAEMCAHALRKDVGAVGARLLYPDGRVQHCGVVVGLVGAAGHPLAGLPGDQAGYLDMATVTRECTAVTGACLATRREVFDLLGGFDETLGVDLNDVDYCLRAGAAGFRTIFEPAAELVHHESPSRGTAGGARDIVRFLARWGGLIDRGDPYFNEHLTRADVSCGLAQDEEQETWNRWYSALTTP